jgi:hypothetical protein
MASTSVVLPWSTWAMIAMLRMPELKKDPSRNMVYYHFTMRGVKSPRKTLLFPSHVILRSAFCAGRRTYAIFGSADALGRIAQGPSTGSGQAFPSLRMTMDL